MAYVDRFIFRFNSVSGKAVRIAIADNDYTGAAVERRLGGSPQLRCELSGNIHGMSLEIPAECKVDDEFAVLYTSDPTRFAVRLEVDNVVVWRGFVTPELYAAPWVDPPYDVQITATDGLGELKMKEWPAIGSRTLKEILDTVLGATGLALGIRMISAAANDIAAAADLLTGTTVNLDHMAGKSYYDVLDGLLGSLHCTISQRNGVWLLVRETDVTSLTSGGQVSDTSGNTYPVKSFGSSQTHDCWPVGRLTTEIVPAKSVVEVECPNKLAALITDPDMELNLWQTNGSWTGEDGGYYTLDLGEYISQTASVANATRDADPGFRIKVSSRNTTPFDVGIMRLTVMTTGRDPRSGSDKTLYLKEVTTQGRTQMEWVAEESHFNDGLGMPKTLDHQDCKEFVTDIFRLPTGFNPIKTITIRVSSGRNTVCVHSVNIECMSVYDKAVTRLLMDNGARGDESYSPLFADSFAGNKGNFLLSNSPKGVTGALVGTWSSEAIPSVPYGEWLSKDMALSVATPRLRMSGRLFTVTSLPALFYSNKGLSYITEEWSLDLIEDEADISLISLPAAALQTVEVSVIVEDNNGRKGTVSGGEIVSPKTGDSSSGSGYLDWFIAESYEEDGETKYRLKLNPKYEGMYAEGWVSAGGVSDQGGGGGGTGYLRDLLDVNASMSPTQGQTLVWDDALGKWTAGDVSVDLTPFERIANRVTTVSSSSNHTQYPTAKAVYDIVNTMLPLSGGTMTNTNLVTNLNADLLDGWHGERYVSYNDDTLGSNVDFNAITYKRDNSIVIQPVHVPNYSGQTNYPYPDYGQMLTFGGQSSFFPFRIAHQNGGGLYYQSAGYITSEVFDFSGRPEWKQIAFTSSNVASATKLETARTIWGQSFDGSGNVNGKFFFDGGDATLKIFSAAGIFPNYGDETVVFQSAIDRQDPETSTLPAQVPERSVISFQPRGGRVGVGTTSPDAELDVVGSIRATNTISMPQIELKGMSASAGHGGFIDFHFQDSSADYTSRIIEDASGRLNVNNSLYVLYNGNVGIGAIPAYKLDVAGDVRTSGKVYIGSTGAYFEVDSNGYLHTNFPLYSDSWISAGGLSDTGEEGGATYLKNLLDVDDNLVESAGYGLVYDGTQWTSEQIVPASRKINGVTLTSDVSLSLGSLSNVSVTGATNGQQLIYNGSEWIAGTPAGAKFFHGTCSTSSSSNTKVVDCPSFTSADLVAGTAIAIVMQNRSDTTSTVTINVNGTGANTLLAGFANRKAWSAQELILAIYDGSGVWDMLPTWYYTYYYGGGGSGGGGGTGSTVVVTPRLSSGTRIATITVDGSASDLYAPSVSVTQSQGSTGGTQIASINSTAIYAPAVTVTQVQASGVEVARIKVGSANPVSIFAPSGSSGSSGVQTVVGRTGDVTTGQIATALTNAGYKLTDTVQDLSGYLPLTAGSSRALTNTLYTRGLLPTANASYDLGSLSAAYNNTYTKRVYLADGVYIEYDSTNRCVYVHGAGIATDSFVSGGGVSTTSN